MRTTLALTLLLCSALSAAAEGDAAKSIPLTGNEIQLSITAPPQSLYVIGEPIPIEWKFTNTTAEPLGMFWEGCCFTYGEIVAEDAKGDHLERKRPPPPPNAPPGWLPDPKAAQAWHAFPMVTRIEPHSIVSFQTVLDNWLVLSRSGKFKLMAKYTGAPESALKQRGPKLRLWNGKAETKTFELELLTPRDYLARRQTNQLNFDPRLSASGDLLRFTQGQMDLQVEVYSSANAPLELSAEAWILDQNGIRIPVKYEAAGTIKVGANSATSKSTVLMPEDLLGHPLGKGYSVFMDVRDADHPEQRCPTLARGFEFTITPDDAVHLIQDAAQNPGARGRRSVSLRTLREYLLDIESLLNAPELRTALQTEAEVALLHELCLAAVLKSAAHANQCVVELHEDTNGRWYPANAHISAELKWGEPIEPAAVAAFAKRIVDVRRHIGLEISFDLLPERETKVGAIRKLVQAMAAVGVESALRARVPNPPPLGSPVWISLIHEPAPRILIACDGRHGLAFREKERDPETPNLEPHFSAAEIEAFRAESKEFLGFDAIRKTAARLRDAGHVLLVLDDEATLDGVLQEVRGVGDLELSY